MSPPGPRAPRAVFLIDAHLLDTLLAALALGTREAALVHAAPQRLVAEIAARVLVRHGIAPRLIEVPARTSPADAGSVLDALDSSWHLHHTGGPEGLAVMLIRAGAERGRPAAAASMLDQERREVRFDDGSALLLRDALTAGTITLTDVLELAGLDRESDTRPRPPAPVVAALAGWALAQGEVRVTAEQVTTLNGLPAELRAAITAPGADPRWWADYLRGRWLEDFVADVLAAAAARLGLGAEVASSVTLRRPGSRLEVDVLALVGHRPHVVSCTASPNPQVARRKAFEAERRAWQIAGPVARPGLVTTMGTEAATQQDTIEAIFSEPLELHRATDLRLFGRVQLEAWQRAGQAGRAARSADRWLLGGLVAAV